jgi:hypothetical protein
MNPSEDVGHRRTSRLALTGRLVLGASVFAVGLLTAGVFSRATPAAPKDCVLPPPAPCVTVPTVTGPSVTVPTVSVPTSTTTTTGTTAATPNSTMTTGTTTTSTSQDDETQSPAAALTAKATVRVIGRGAKRVVEIRLRLSQKVNVRAQLRRNRSMLARLLFPAPSGASVKRLHVPLRTKAGAAALDLVYRAASGQTLRATYRLRLPR